MPDFLLVVCSLLGVIGLIFITYYATKWLNKKFQNGGWNGSQNGIKIIECLGIAQDKQLLVIKAGRKSMLIGVTPNSVTKLADLDEFDMAILEKPADAEKGGSFAENLKKAMGSIGKKNSSSDSENNAEFKQEDSYGNNDNDDF